MQAKLSPSEAAEHLIPKFKELAGKIHETGGPVVGRAVRISEDSGCRMTESRPSHLDA